MKYIKIGSIDIKASEPKFWRNQYKKELPHWMSDKNPSKFAKRFVKDMKDNNLDKGNILEIGIGNGRDSIFFSKQGFKVKGIDIDKKPVEVSRKRKGKLPIEFNQMDAEKLKFLDEEFDGVYSLSVLHSTDVSKSFGEVKRVLKLNGIFLSFLYYLTSDSNGKSIDNHVPLSKILKTVEDLNFEILDLYIDLKKEEVDDEHGVPHTHSSVILFLKKK